MRAALDRLVSWLGLAVALVLLVAGALLTYGHNFIKDEVHDQLAAQQIYFPPAESDAVAGDEYARMREFGGEQMTTGEQAEIYANDFISNHLKATGGGKTYAELSTESKANPDDAELAAKVDTMFKGETLRGLLLNAYAFGTAATIAGVAAIGAYIAAALMVLLAVLGFVHARRSDTVADQAQTPPTPLVS